MEVAKPASESKLHAATKSGPLFMRGLSPILKKGEGREIGR